MDIQQYLDRINFHSPLKVNKECLYLLQKAHLLNVPFENLDIHYNQKISLQIKDIYNKVVLKNRGGFCYELNGLFHQLLKNIGFNTKLISARVYIKDELYSPDYDHLAILVTLEDKEYLVDVGFGDFSLEPLELKLDKRIKDTFGSFQFDKYDADFFRINEVKNNVLIPQYIFKNEAHELSEFNARCEFHQTSNDSHFTQKKLISIAKIDGRLTLNDTQLKVSQSGIEKITPFELTDFKNKLQEYFNIEI